jgi:hypothetical protein
MANIKLGFMASSERERVHGPRRSIPRCEYELNPSFDGFSFEMVMDITDENGYNKNITLFTIRKCT